MRFYHPQTDRAGIRQTGVMTAPRIDGRSLARFHADGTATDDGIRLLSYAESPRVDDWSLRGALVRYAQPRPTRASAVLELVRRTDAALKPFGRALERTLAPTLPGLSPADFTPDGLDADRPTRIDARSTDLARVLAHHADALDGVVAAYEEVSPLGEEERTALPLLAVAVHLDGLGDVLARWASRRDDSPPDDEVDRVNRLAFSLLGALGVEREPRQPNRV